MVKLRAMSAAANSLTARAAVEVSETPDEGVELAEGIAHVIPSSGSPGSGPDDRETRAHAQLAGVGKGNDHALWLAGQASGQGPRPAGHQRPRGELASTTSGVSASASGRYVIEDGGHAAAAIRSASPTQPSSS